MKSYFLCLLTLLAGAAIAQPQSQRDADLRELAAYREKANQAYQNALDSNKLVAERVSSIREFPVIYDPQLRQRAINIVLDAGQADELRAALLPRVLQETEQNARLFDAVLAFTANPQTPTQLRQASLGAAQTLSFWSGQAATNREQITATMQQLVRDKDIAFRRVALNVLSQYNDQSAKAVLLDGLKNPQQAALSLEESLSYLGNYDKIDFYPQLIELTRNLNNSEPVRNTAVRLLGFSREAGSTLLTIALNPKESKTMRFGALASLHTNAPDKFPGQVEKLVFNEQEDDELRAYCIRTVMFTRQANQYRLKTKQPDSFDRRVAQLSERSGKLVQQAAQEYVLNVNSKF